MTSEQLQWALLAINAAPIANTNEARHKAAALIDLAERMDEAAKPAPVNDPD